MHQSTTRSLTGNDEPVSADLEVQNLGYVPVYRRVFGILGSVCSVISVASPIGVFVAVYYQIIYGGYWGLSWGWIIPAILCVSQPLAIAELCSSIPVNGAFYWWTAALAPKSISRPLSFIVGWTNCMSLLTSLASFAYASASSIAYVISILRPDWVPTNSMIMGIAMGMVLFWGLINTLPMEKFQWVFFVTTAVMVLTNFIYVIAVPVTHAKQNLPFASAAQVFGEYTNSSLYDESIAVPMSFFCAVWVITGWQAPAFIAEETQNASRVAPRAIITSYIAIAFGGVVVCLVTAFCIPDILVAAADPSGFPMYTLVIEHWGKNVGCGFLMVLLLTGNMGGPSLLLTSASQVAAFARDGGLPFPHIFSHIHQSSNMPLAAIGLLVSGAILILLFALSTMARTIIFSLAVIAYLLTFAIPILLRITCHQRFVPGPLTYGRFSIPIHMWALSTICYFIIMESFPSSPDWTSSTFNYSWVISLGIVGLASVLWPTVRKNFRSIELQAFGGELHDVNATVITAVSSKVGNGSAQRSANEDGKAH